MSGSKHQALIILPSPLAGEGGGAPFGAASDEGAVQPVPLTARLGSPPPHPGLRATFSRKGRRKKVDGCSRASTLRIQPVGRVQGAHRKLGVGLVNQHTHFYLRGADRLDVDALVSEGTEHPGGDTGMAAHADANH